MLHRAGFGVGAIRGSTWKISAGVTSPALSRAAASERSKVMYDVHHAHGHSEIDVQKQSQNKLKLKPPPQILLKILSTTAFGSSNNVRLHYLKPERSNKLEPEKLTR
jgi:hypothetical protein